MNNQIIKERLSLARYNEMAQTAPAALVEESENDYYGQIKQIAEHIKNNKERYKVVLLAGPSASGKTTTASKLRKRLGELGIQSVYVSLDNFFFDRDKLPLLPDGMPDFESIRTLDMDCLKAFFSDLLQTNHATVPVFDFNSGKRSDETIELTIDDNFVVIIEGIHALNPIITADHYSGNFCKLYISPKSEYESEGKVVLNSRNVRLIRRLVRDYHFRGSDPVNTMKMWKHVVEGENIYIRPFRTTADFWINSMHKYEPMIFHHYLLPILENAAEKSEYQATFAELRDTLELFYDLDKEIVPPDSLLREFIG